MVKILTMKNFAWIQNHPSDDVYFKTSQKTSYITKSISKPTMTNVHTNLQVGTYNVGFKTSRHMMNFATRPVISKLEM